MNRLTGAARTVAGEAAKQVGRLASRVQEASLLPVDVLESDDAYLLIFDAAGAAASDVQVRYRRNAVEVRIDRFREYHEGYEMRFPGRGMSLDGRARLPNDALVDPDTATATLRDNGTLEVRLPKRAAAGSSEEPIVVETGEAPEAEE